MEGFDKALVFREMATRKVVRAEVEYSGGNDEGGADTIRLFHEDGHKEELEPYDNTDVLIDQLSELPGLEYGSFAGDFSVSGTFVVDLATRSIKMDGQESSYEPVSREF